MKTKLIALLKTSFASKGFSQKTLEGIADRLIENNNLTDQSTDEDFNSGIEAFKPFADLMQSEISRQVNEKKVPAVETPTNPVVPVVTPEAPTTTDPVLLALLAELKELKTGLATVQGEKVATTRREKFIKSMDGTSPEYQARELKRFDRITFKDDEDFTSFLEDTKEDHSAAIQEAADQGLGGDRPTGGIGVIPKGGEKEVSPLMKDFLTAQAAKTKTIAV